MFADNAFSHRESTTTSMIFLKRRWLSIRTKRRSLLRLLRTLLLLVSMLLLKHRGDSASKEGMFSTRIPALVAHDISPGINISSSMNEKQISEGDIAPCWFTVHNAGERLKALDFNMHLPFNSTKFLGSSVFPPQEKSAGQEVAYIDTDGAFVVRWKGLTLAPGQSLVFNVDFRVISISETGPINIQGLVEVMDTEGIHDTSELTITLTKRPKITQKLLSEQRAKRFGSNPVRSFSSGHQTFERCRRLQLTPAKVEKCLNYCQNEGQSCLGCGFDQRTGCVCKRKKGDDRLIESVFPQEAWEDRSTKDSKLDLSDDRRCEILVFPSLLSEEQLSAMKSYLSDLVLEHSEQRMILETTNTSSLHRLIRDILPMSNVQFEDYVTFSEENVEVQPHYDAIKGGESHKLLLFLDEIAGTRFWESQDDFERNHCPLVVKPSRGTVVIFPMSLYHDSARFEPRNSIKRTLGLRVRLPFFDMTEAGTIGLVQAPVPIQEKL